MSLQTGQQAPDARVYKCTGCGYLTALLKGEIVAPCPKCAPEKKVYAWAATHHEIMVKTKNLAEEARKQETWSDKVADKIAIFCGNMIFVYAHALIFLAWVLYNWNNATGFDPYPFGVLTMLVSLEAIILSSFILISQNRQSSVSDLRSELDYQVNLRSEKLISEVRAMLHEMNGKR
ncbi:MAG: DUF1003 domain-containing protein [Candidatus Woesearchaeota archaeon]|nr:DUF1003 domain-containing protein [Candidatus Woesearchaeota archaeon]